MIGLRRLNSAKYVGEGCRGAIRELIGLKEEEEEGDEGVQRPCGISPHAPAGFPF